MLAGSCGTPICEGDKEELVKGGSSTNGLSVSGEEGVLLAGTSVFVLKPGEQRGTCRAPPTLLIVIVFTQTSTSFIDATLSILTGSHRRTSSAFGLSLSPAPGEPV